MRFLTAGESHGKSLIGIIEGYPSGIFVDPDFINDELHKRQKGYGRGGRMKIERDVIEIMSGVRKNKSTGGPISFIINNRDWENWKSIMAVTSIIKNKDISEKKLSEPRPGHADLNGIIKYRLDDIRDVIERSSARETAARVAAGSFARIFLNYFNITIYSYVTSIGKISIKNKIKISQQILDLIEKSPVRCPDTTASGLMIQEIKKAEENGDSLGGKFKVIAEGVMPGLGSYSQWDTRLDSKIAGAIMSIPAIKAIEIGEGFKSSGMVGSECHDQIYYDKDKKRFYRNTNIAGGIEGGISNGEDIIVGASMKPIPTTGRGLRTVNFLTKDGSLSLKERSDVCAVPSAAIVGEAMLALEMAKACLEKFGTDNIDEIVENFNNYNKYLASL